MIREIDSVLAQWGERVVGKIRDNLDRTNTTAGGKTKESLEVEITDGGLRILGRQYFQGVEEGRPSGKVPYNFTDIIRQWMSDKKIENQFGETESEKRSAAYFIGRFIRDHGTRLFLAGGRDDIYTNVFTDELPKLEDEIKYTIQDSILRNFQ